MPVKFKENRKVQTTQNEFFMTKKKIVLQNHFWQRVDVVLEEVSVAETII